MQQWAHNALLRAPSVSELFTAPATKSRKREHRSWWYAKCEEATSGWTCCAVPPRLTSFSDLIVVIAAKHCAAHVPLTQKVSFSNRFSKKLSLNETLLSVVFLTHTRLSFPGTHAACLFNSTHFKCVFLRKNKLFLFVPFFSVLHQACTRLRYMNGRLPHNVCFVRDASRDRGSGLRLLSQIALVVTGTWQTGHWEESNSRRCC